MKKLLSLILVASMMANLCACSNTDTNISDNDSANNESVSAEKTEEPLEEKIDIICDITEFANITGKELIAILGEPDEIADTTPAVGFVEIPCQYYEYYNHEEIGEASFILINDSVAKFITYKEFPLNEDEKLLESLNVEKSDDCALVGKTDTSIRYRCLTEEIDDLSVELIEDGKFGFMSVIYDMFYFEEWYLTMSVNEQSNYQYWTQETVKALLKSPKSADFPNILKWSFGKNKFYVAVSSYVDAQNSFGAELRSEFTFVYQANTQNVVYAIFDGEVIYDDGYIPTSELVKELVKTVNKEGKEQIEETKTADNAIPPEAALVSESNEDNVGNNTVLYDTPAFEGSTCLEIDYNTGMPQSTITEFDGLDTVMIAGRLIGVNGENNLTIHWVFPDGYVHDTPQYYIVNNQTINTGFSAEYIGSGTGSVSVILNSTGQTLATYYYTISGAPTYYDTEIDDINTQLTEQNYLDSLPSLDDFEWEEEYDSDIFGIETPIPEELWDE